MNMVNYAGCAVERPNMHDISTAIGRIVMVRESQFLLSADNGREYLLTLAATASVDAADLLDMYEHGIRIVVTYQEETGPGCGIARAIQALNRVSCLPF